ncbi:MAG: VWA domain-containing protein [Deltaproteobacteria bacterium]|nr:VWA domain-containing protein [Deltaproteobacteria bacterium]
MTLARPYMLNLLWLLPVAVFVLVVLARRRKRQLQALAEEHLLPALAPIESRGKVVFRSTAFLLAAALAVFASAGPRWGERYQEVSQKGVDILLCVDVSQSMLVSDVKPNRLERARREVADLIAVAGGNRLGLVTFAGAAFLQCPLTLDYAALEMYMNQLSPDLISSQGTDLGAAILTAMDGFDPESAADKVILLFTDGEDNEGRGMAAAQKAAEQGIRIFVFGMGDPSGGPVPAREGGGFLKDADGRMVISKLNEAFLSGLARTGGGVYVRSVDTDQDLDRVYFSGILKKTTPGEVKSGKITLAEERFYLFCLLAFAVLFCEGVVREKGAGNHRV